jgi:hypothetical protein
MGRDSGRRRLDQATCRLAYAVLSAVAKSLDFRYSDIELYRSKNPGDRN